MQRSLLLAGGLFFFYVVEYVIPYMPFRYRKVKHAGVNIFFTITTALVNMALAFLIIWCCDFMQSNRFGLLYILPLPLWVFIISGLLILDLISAWLIHFLQHKIKWMWKFHLVHHTDTHVDATTANRHHPGESLFRFVFTLLAVLVSGAPVWLFLLYQSFSALLSQFNHANISLNPVVDKIISLVLVSPNMHKVHHHFMQPYTDSNYANIFSIWDRIFGTYRNVKKENLIYGIDTHMHLRNHSDIKTLLSLPFQEYRIPPGSKFDEADGAQE
ncbi:MAG: sterol desaturase family protein [Ferruginibacter sp.]